MTSMEYTTEDYIQERIRLWRTEKEPEVTKQCEAMKLQNDAQLGRLVRDIVSQFPEDPEDPRERRELRRRQLRLIKTACSTAQAEEKNIENTLHEGVEAAVANLKSAYLKAVIEHPDEVDPTTHVHEHLSQPTTKQAYCSPVLQTLLRLENADNLQPSSALQDFIARDFPARADALLEYHHIAFHADIAVVMQLYEPELLGDKTKRREVLQLHQEKMEKLMVAFGKKMQAEVIQDAEIRRRERDDAGIAKVVEEEDENEKLKDDRPEAAWVVQVPAHPNPTRTSEENTARATASRKRQRRPRPSTASVASSDSTLVPSREISRTSTPLGRPVKRATITAQAVRDTTIRSTTTTTTFFSEHFMDVATLAQGVEEAEHEYDDLDDDPTAAVSPAPSRSVSEFELEDDEANYTYTYAPSTASEYPTTRDFFSLGGEWRYETQRRGTHQSRDEAERAWARGLAMAIPRSFSSDARICR